MQICKDHTFHYNCKGATNSRNCAFLWPPGMWAWTWPFALLLSALPSLPMAVPAPRHQHLLRVPAGHLQARAQQEQSGRSASEGPVAPGSRSTAVFDHLTGQQEKTEPDSSQRCRVTGGEAMDTNKTFWPRMRKSSFTIKLVKVLTRSPKLVDPPPLNIFKLQLDTALRQPDLTGGDLSRGWTGWYPSQPSLLYNATTC